MIYRLLARAKTSLKSRLPGKKNEDGVGDYHSISLTPGEIAAADYKRHLGGGANAWRTRGLFQLQLLKDHGFSPASSCLDIGCGPLRAGVHIIAYLDKGRYVGMDFNKSLIAAARHVVAEHGLAEKDPALLLSQDFSISGADRKFDYAIAFSVLNHCDARSKRAFFDRTPSYLGEGGKLFISHAGWLQEAMVRDSGLRVLEIIGAERYDLAPYGWRRDEAAKVFPIFELARQES